MGERVELEQVLADARGEKLSRASFSSFRVSEGQESRFSLLKSAKTRPLTCGEVPNPTSGNFGARIMTLMTYLYYLADPRTPRHPRYVGITGNPAERERRHRSWNSTTDQFRSWKKELRAAGLAPKLIVVTEFEDREQASRAEWRLMHRWMRRGFCDCNSGVEGSTERFALYCAGMRRSRVA
jgi:predicted GIY-YIG superfamily endonuclease